MITAAIITFGILLLAWLAAPEDPASTDVAPAAEPAPLAEAA